MAACLKYSMSHNVYYVKSMRVKKDTRVFRSKKDGFSGPIALELFMHHPFCLISRRWIFH
jgi:hypothetical protein